MFWHRMLFCATVLLVGTVQAATTSDSPIQEEQQSEVQRQQLINEAQPLLRKECFRLFEKYLDDAGQKSFFYTIDKEGRYACGKSAKLGSRKAADDAALAECMSDKSRRGAKMPNPPCRMYARENELLLSQADYGLEITPAEQRILTTEAYRAYVEEADEVLGVKCLAEFRIYIRSQGHKSFYYAMDKQGRYACGSADGAIAASAAQNVALRHCNAHRKKEKVLATCKPYANGYEIIAKPEDFGIVHGLEDFQRALSKGILSRVRKYVAEGLDINTASAEGITPLFLAAMKGDYGAYQSFLKQGGDPQHKLKDNSNLLLVAVMGENLNIIRDALERGFDINAPGFKGNTPLHVAIMKANLYIGGLLSLQGADSSIANEAGETPLKMLGSLKLDAIDLDNSVNLVEAAKNNDIIGLQALLSNSPGPDRQEALNEAIRLQAKLELETFKFLIEAGAQVNCAFDDGETPLMSAAEAGNQTFVAYLLSKGADKWVKNGAGKTAYELAKEPEVKALLR